MRRVLSVTRRCGDSRGSSSGGAAAGSGGGGGSSMRMMHRLRQLLPVMLLVLVAAGVSTTQGVSTSITVVGAPPLASSCSVELPGADIDAANTTTIAMRLATRNASQPLFMTHVAAIVLQLYAGVQVSLAITSRPVEALQTGIAHAAVDVRQA